MEDIKSLLLKHLRAQTTAEEQTAIDAWLAASEANRELFAELNDPDRVARSLEKMDRLHEDQVWERLQAYTTGKPPAHRVHFLRRYGWAAAAAFFVLLGTGAWWVFHNAAKEHIAQTQQQRFRNDVAPGKNAAVLTLAGGQKIVLDSTAKGAITRQGNTTIHNTSGQLVYNALHGKPAELLYNTLTTGRGNLYQLILPDGSKVWLNAASSITYPTSFTGAERKVAMTGEAYFEIAKDERRPFIVEKKEMRIQVLGTHFNVNTYDDEDAWRTTLLEGSVKVIKGNNSSVLRPGQQAILSRDNAPIKVLDHPDIDDVMAWKNGVFRFNDATIESIMREMARWYDVEVVYDARISQHFIADVPRDVPASELLKLLELTDQVHFKIEGKKITVIR
ncbi:FecR domain-containing protein [Flavitalea sp. BT771]|uniref:FecR family protein n=1 Tax=Flavitalea sp. BT771 TaxID=3063329 RepID=UPI0026E2B500|nr:FecR family protein [Flavitalea sp. BT771]MDO6430247.1 FecR domain-containing protein [Flavitalea sp. BT771]MDV6219613.1 FecR domain-containing protein [Flavitalea sp. BT771]